jgi:hypothetical protein
MLLQTAIDTAIPEQHSSSNSSRATAPRLCLVQGCSVDLSAPNVKPYCWKCQLCIEHMHAEAVQRKGCGNTLFRFCQQCGERAGSETFHCVNTVETCDTTHSARVAMNICRCTGTSQASCNKQHLCPEHRHACMTGVHTSVASLLRLLTVRVVWTWVVWTWVDVGLENKQTTFFLYFVLYIRVNKCTSDIVNALRCAALQPMLINLMTRCLLNCRETRAARQVPGP